MLPRYLIGLFRSFFFFQIKNQAFIEIKERMQEGDKRKSPMQKELIRPTNCERKDITEKRLQWLRIRDIG